MRIDTDTPNLEDDIKSNSEFITLMADSNFCVELWSALVNNDWVKLYDITDSDTDKIFDILKYNSDHRTWSASFRYVGGIIADIRNAAYNSNEDYLTWYCCGPQGDVSDRVELELKKMGWVPSTIQDTSTYI